MSVIAGIKTNKGFILLQNLEEPLRLKIITGKGFSATYDRKTLCGLNIYGVGVVSLPVPVKKRADRDMTEFIYDHLPDAKSAGELIDKLKTYPKDGHNFIIADRDSLYTVETSPGNIKIKNVGQSVRTSHHILLETEDQKIDARDKVRLNRALTLISTVKDTESAKNFLRDHNFGKTTNSICSHGNFDTHHSFILTPDTALYAEGHPCRTKFKSFEL